MTNRLPAIGPHDVLVEFLEASNVVERRSQEFFAPYDLTPAQFNILNVLGLAGGELSQRELIGKLVVGKATTSIVLKRMLHAGWIKGREDREDRRKKILKLTADGKRLWERVAPKYDRSVYELFATLDGQTMRRFHRELSRFRNAVNETANGVKHE